MSGPMVKTGAVLLVESNFDRLRGRKIGLICNPTTVDHRLRHLADLLHHAEGVQLSALFGPEHGIRGEVQDMLEVGHVTDPATGLPTYSLYGANEASLTPTAAQLEGLDVLVFDIQDVGSRYYTFAATMLYAMKAASKLGLSFLVLDRPNPIGGTLVEGPSIQPGFESFVGAYPLPSRHGMSVGELALLFRDELKLDLDLEVLPCQGWSRDQHWPATGLPWVSPSPNMPSPLTALVYPGACLLEGTCLSEGRGTTRPFELWGAPWSQPAVTRFLVDLLRDSTVRHLGAWGRFSVFVPTFHKHAGQACYGVQPFAVNPATFQSLPFYLTAIGYEMATAETRPHFAWRTEPYEFVSDPIAIDLLFGSSRERLLLEDQTRDGRWSCEAALEITGLWNPDVAAFHERRQPYLLYH